MEKDKINGGTQCTSCSSELGTACNICARNSLTYEVECYDSIFNEMLSQKEDKTGDCFEPESQEKNLKCKEDRVKSFGIQSVINEFDKFVIRIKLEGLSTIPEAAIDQSETFFKLEDILDLKLNGISMEEDNFPEYKLSIIQAEEIIEVDLKFKEDQTQPLEIKVGPKMLNFFPFVFLTNFYNSVYFEEGDRNQFRRNLQGLGFNLPSFIQKFITAEYSVEDLKKIVNFKFMNSE